MGMTSTERSRLKRARERECIDSKPSVAFPLPNTAGLPVSVDSHVVENTGEKNTHNNGYLRARLGKYAKSTSRPEPCQGIDPGTGELLDPDSRLVDARLELFALQSSARRILPGSQTANCLRAYVPVPVGQVPPMPEVWRSPESGATRYRRLLVCGRVWWCPVCACYISERRRGELLQAIELHKRDGGDVLLLTLTTPHGQHDRLAELLGGQAKALGQYFFGGKMMKRLYDDIGYVGGIRALEVTHGRRREVNNGWHPHYHVLLFVQSGLDLFDLRLAFYKRWVNACLKAGLEEPSWEHGLALHDGTEAAYYAGKWGLESEMTKGHTKKSSRQSGETPFDLLRAYLYDNDRQAAALFKEFADAFKGKRQLFWSSGLKAHFNIGEVSDEEAANHSEDTSDMLGRIDFEDWRNILKFDIRAEILELSRHSWASVQDLLLSLRS